MAKRIKKVYIDTEFFEGFTKPLFGKPQHIIDLISIGMVDNKGDEYYAISSEFDISRAWNKFDLHYEEGQTTGEKTRKVYWLRDNVLTPIFWELVAIENAKRQTTLGDRFFAPDATLSNLKTLVKRHGKSRKTIAEDIRHFVYFDALAEGEGMDGMDKDLEYWLEHNVVQFYAHFADYDWVAFCALFGRMIDLPPGFPMYCRDTKQQYDDSSLPEGWKEQHCPDPEGEHNALVDARWCRLFHGRMNVADVTTTRRMRRQFPCFMPGVNIVTDNGYAEAMVVGELMQDNPTIQVFAERMLSSAKLIRVGFVKKT